MGRAGNTLAEEVFRPKVCCAGRPLLHRQPQRSRLRVLPSQPVEIEQVANSPRSLRCRRDRTDDRVIRTRTTFVVGAGGSVPYGLPTAIELRKQAIALKPDSDVYQLLTRPRYANEAVNRPISVDL